MVIDIDVGRSMNLNGRNVRGQRAQLQFHLTGMAVKLNISVQVYMCTMRIGLASFPGLSSMCAN